MSMKSIKTAIQMAFRDKFVINLDHHYVINLDDTLTIISDVAKE